MNPTLSRIPLFDELVDSKTILLAGAGGGYDITSGIPLYVALNEMGKEVIMANLSFSLLADGEKISSICYKVDDADTRGQERSKMGEQKRRDFEGGGTKLQETGVVVVM